MFECKSEVPYVITLEGELSQMPLKMRFLDVKQVREGGLQYFYAVIANFRHARRLVEGFWGILKRERYYGRRFTCKRELVQMIETYIHYYNTRRVQRNLGVLTPMEKHELGLAA